MKSPVCELTEARPFHMALDMATTSSSVVSRHYTKNICTIREKNRNTLIYKIAHTNIKATPPHGQLAIPSSPMNRNVLNVETHQFLLILRARPWEEQASTFPFVSKAFFHPSVSSSRQIFLLMEVLLIPTRF